MMALGESLVALVWRPGVDDPQNFTDAFKCRDFLKAVDPSFSVVVFESIANPQVTPLNLAAALKHDCPGRSVKLLVQTFSGSLVTRAERAGVELIESLGQEYLGRPKEQTGYPEPRIEDLETGLMVDAYKGQPPALAAPAELSEKSALGAEGAGQTRPEASEGAPQKPAARAIAFISGRGGVGKSTMALLLALLATRRGRRVALIEADFQFGDLASSIGHEQNKSIVACPIIRCTEERADELVRAMEQQNGRPGLLLLSAPTRPEEADQAAQQIELLLPLLTSRFDLVFIDTGSYWTDSQALLARKCSQLLFFMDQRSASLAACSRLKELCLSLQIPEARFRFVLNGCGRGAPLTAEDASFVLGGQEVWALDDGGSLVDELLALGCPQELLKNANPFVSSLERLLDNLEPRALGAAQAPAAIQERRLFGFRLPDFGSLFSRRSAHVAQ
ncbi:MAG: AAA family ATPase [Coriobacteriia bacterium]|nr:AAA family ATPase [Coriobacteriia bacterium]